MSSNPPPAPRALYGQAELRRALQPRSIAIIGASARPGAFGRRVFENLAAFSGQVHLVNPKYTELLGRPCYPSIAAVPELVDCVVLGAAREAVESAIEECIAADVAGVVVFASGFAETGKPEFVALQERLTQRVRGTATRLFGPNTIGMFNYLCGAHIGFSPMGPVQAPQPFAVGIASQSGAMGTALAQAMAHGVSISHTLTSGNSCDVDVADYVNYLADDPACQAIVCVFEGVRDPARMLAAAARAWAVDKPLLIHKMAVGTRGAAAALSHTGSLVGETATWRATLERHGAIWIDRLEDLMETASFFAKAPRVPRANGVAVVSTSGGAAIMAGDKAEAHGVDLPELLPETERFLATMVPDYGSPKNPCDLTAQALSSPESLRACADALLAEDRVGVLVNPHPLAYDDATWRFAMFGELARRRGKVFCAVWFNEWLEGPGSREAETNPDVCLFRSMDRCFAALAAWQRRAAWRALADVAPVSRSAERREHVAARLRAAAPGTLTERASKELLAAYGVPVTPDVLATDAARAVAAATAMGYPVVAKLESPDVAHKTDAGVVRLNLRAAEEVEAAVADILARAATLVPVPRIHGVAIQPMIPAGLELMIGARRDPQFGPLVVVGLGGVLVEVLRDTVTEPAPVTPARALTMLERLRGARLLDGYRGASPVDRQRLATIVAAVSWFIAEQAELVAEVDLNPLICHATDMVAVDALVVRG